jgi:hypothetical protein
MCVTFYVCVRSYVFSYKISCDGAILFLCAEIQKCDENGEIWRLYRSNYILKFFLFYAQKWIAWTLIFHFSSTTMGTQSTFFYDLIDGWIKIYWQCITEILCVKNVLSMKKWNTTTLCMKYHFAHVAKQHVQEF